MSKPTTSEELHKLYITEWSVDLTPRTRYRLKMELGRWRKFTGDPKLREISTATYQKFRLDTAKAGLAPSTTESTLRVIRAMLRCGKAHGLIEDMPERGRARRIEAPEPNPPTADELDAFLRAVHVAKWPKTLVRPSVFWTSLVAVGCFTGMRRGDLLGGLTWAEVDFKERVIAHRAQKTSRAHEWPITDVLERHLRNMLPKFALPGEMPVFPAPAGGHQLQVTLEAICGAAKLRPITLKMLRQYSISAWTIAGGEAGQMIHGCWNMPRVMRHYVSRMAVLRAVSEDVVMPSELLK